MGGVTDEDLARAIAVWHGSRMVGSDHEGQMQTVASRRGYGRWGHSAYNYARAHWRDYTQAAEAARRLCQPQWQPIETAPKPATDDKTIPVLLAFHYPKTCADPRSMIPGTAEWAGRFWGCLVMSWDASNQCWDDGMGNNTSDYDAESEQPTHWMPLPEPPA